MGAFLTVEGRVASVGRTRNFHGGGMANRSSQLVLLKVSGEALGGPDGIFPFDPDVALRIAEEVRDAHNEGIKIAIVVGGGNIFRGANGASKGMDRVPADQFGMMATIQNGIVMRDMLERRCNKTVRLMSALNINDVAEPYIVQRAKRHLEHDHIIILAGGTGHAYCTTDYAAAVRASEIGVSTIVKATNVDGIYDKDPRKHPDAVMLKTVSYERCLRDELKVMDTEAFALCRDERISIRVFSILEHGNITRALKGESLGTLVTL